MLRSKPRRNEGETLSRCFQVCRIRASQRGWQPLRAELEERTLPTLAKAGVRPWGLWYGLFGLRSNELVMVTSWPQDAATVSVLTDALPAGAEVLELYEFVPTVRPVTDDPCTRAGLYVFRFFDVRNEDVEEIAQLSATAWETFEAASTYQSVPQALFCQRDRSSEKGVMLLLTWYDGLNSWQASRQPAPEAAQNFRRRAQLTLGTVAYATRLVGQ